ncbi:MAG: methyltransferase protein [Acidimicrobiales bacterium]|nr:methyltransferase protein [Acidimicrobiales bacterium]
MAVHPAAAAGFDSGAAAYERGRPSYPATAVDLLVEELGIRPGATVVDLGAGTGKWTRLLVERGARVVAVEPVAGMREQLGVAVPGVEVLDAPAEAVPLPDGSVDAVTAAQAFHWFDRPTALAECARLLRPGGGLGMVWNARDDSVPWVAELDAIMTGQRGGVPAYDADIDFAAAVAADGRFTPLQHRAVGSAQEVDEAVLLDRVSSTSYIAALPEDRRAEVLESVRRLVAGFPPRFTLPHRTDVFWCHRRSTP